MAKAAAPLIDRLAAKVEIAADGCWHWTDKLDPRGYGRLHVQGIPQLAHRVVYQEVVGRIPNGLEIDHLCRKPACVNPDHLEPVTHRVNVLRGNGIAARNAVVTECPKGHAYNEANTHVRRSGQRECRACARERMALARSLR